MADTSAFPTIRNVIKYSEGGTIRTKKASGAIKRGMVVCYADAGVEDTVLAGLPSLGLAAGVALDDAADGEYFAVAGNGCEVYVSEGAGSTIDVGHAVMIDDCAVGGCVIEWDPAIGAHAATAGVATNLIIGYARSDFAANGTGRILIQIGPPQFTAAS